MDELRVDPARKPSEARGKTVAKPHSPLRPVLWTGLVLALIAALAWWIHTRPAPKPPSGRFALSGPMPVVAARRPKGRHRHHLQRARNGDAARHGDGADPDRGPARRRSPSTKARRSRRAISWRRSTRAPTRPRSTRRKASCRRDQAALKRRASISRATRSSRRRTPSRSSRRTTRNTSSHQDEGTVKLDQAQVDNAKLNLGLLPHRRAGRPAASACARSIPATTSRWAAPPAIAVITQLQPISVIFTLPEDELPAVMKRLHAGAHAAGHRLRPQQHRPSSPPARWPRSTARSTPPPAR